MSSRTTDTTVTQPKAQRRGKVFAEGYEILRRLGEGGMGEVFEAQQKRPVERRVALKVIKRGMDSAAVVARFESERQALALMDHPAIARIYDAGVTAGGRPFFAMELVRGIPIVDYCDERLLTTRERIELFVRVCLGVQHAHQKGVIHRDLKPSNVLITESDGQPVPKIIDFGISKATAQPATERTAYFDRGQLVGTPEYMSPEQAGVTAHDVDTRSDVYALGVLLYRLLTGTLPFEAGELRPTGYDEIRRKIREDAPARPSTRAGALDTEPALAAARVRRVSRRAFVRRLRGDLDRIVMKALEKDRDRRYGSASDLAADLVRHLENRPVEAGPASTLYRLRKLVARHRPAVAAGALVALALILGIVGTTLSLARAQRAEAQARQEAETALQVSDFLVELFQVSDPGGSRGSPTRGQSLTVREFLDRGAARVERELAHQPLTQARMQRVMGKVYGQLGLYDQASALLEAALATHRQRVESGHRELAQSLADLAEVRLLQGLSRQGEGLYREALEIQEQALGPDHPEVAESLRRLANALRQLGRYPEAVTLCQRALRIVEEVYGPDHLRVADVLGTLGGSFWGQRRFDDAEDAFVRALAIRESSPVSRPLDLARSRENLGILYSSLERNDEAERILKAALEATGQMLGPDHPETSRSRANLAALYARQGRLDEAEPLFLRALEVYENSLDSDSHYVWRLLHSLGLLYLESGRLGEAEPTLLRAFDIGQRAIGTEHPDLAMTQASLADLYRTQERFEEAESFYRQALDLRERSLAPDDPLLTRLAGRFAAMLKDLGRDGEAAVLKGKYPRPEELSGDPSG